MQWCYDGGKNALELKKPPQAAAPAGAGLYEQYYQQYLTQLTQQGYDEATAQQYAAQYAQAALQQQQ